MNLPHLITKSRLLFRMIPLSIVILGFVFPIPLQSYVETTENIGTTWSQVPFEGMGFVTGVQFHPTINNLVYARTDVGGIYRKNPSSGDRWYNLFDGFAFDKPGIPYVEAMAVTPLNSGIIAATSGNIRQFPNGEGYFHYSTDFGDTWRTTEMRISATGEKIAISGNDPQYRGGGERLVIHPTNPGQMYYASRNNGLLQTNDAGATWGKVTSFPTNGEQFSGLQWVEFDTSVPNGQRFFVAVYNDGIYETVNGGVSWNKLPSHQFETYPYRAQVVNGDLYASYTEENIRPGEFHPLGGLWKYSGGVWENISPLSPFNPGDTAVTAFQVDVNNPQRIFADVVDYFRDSDNASLRVTLDGGQTWNVVEREFSVPTWYSQGKLQEATSDLSPYISSSGFYVSQFQINPFNPEHVVLANGWGIFESQNISAATSQWNTDMDGIEELVMNESIKVPDGPLLSIGWDMGLLSHDDDTQLPQYRAGKFEFLNNFSSVVYSTKNPQTLYAVGNNESFSDIQGQFIASATGGDTWVEKTLPTSDTIGGTLAISSSNTQHVAIAARQASGTNFFEGNSGGFYYTRNGGGTWQPSQGIPQGQNLQGVSLTSRSITTDPFVGETFYVYHCNENTGWKKQIYISTDGGASYSLQNENSETLPCVGGMAMRADPFVPNRLWFSGWNAAQQDRKAYVSDDAGKTWRAANGIENVTHIGVGKGFHSDGSTVYALGEVDGLYGLYMASSRIDDNTFDWIRMSPNNLGLHSVGTITGDPQKPGVAYIAIQGRGTWKAEFTPSQMFPTNPTPSNPIGISFIRPNSVL